MIGLMIPSVFAQTPTILVLNPIPATVEAGNEIVFSGKFNTESGNSIQNAEIFIKDDVKFGIDKYIGSITTDENGEFYATWIAEPRQGGGAYDFFAAWEFNQYGYDFTHSEVYSVQVISSTTSTEICDLATFNRPSLLLDELPEQVNAGDTITFSGRLICSDGNTDFPNILIEILDEEAKGFIDSQLITTTRTNSQGEFSVTWQSRTDFIETDLDFFARADCECEGPYNDGRDWYVDSYPQTVIIQ